MYEGRNGKKKRICFLLQTFYPLMYIFYIVGTVKVLDLLDFEWILVVDIIKDWKNEYDLEELDYMKKNFGNNNSLPFNDILIKDAYVFKNGSKVLNTCNSDSDSSSFVPFIN